MSNNTSPAGHSLVDDRMRRFSSSRYTVAGGFLWGLCEGTFFFIVPDVLSTLVALFRLRSGLMVMVSSILGSLVSAAVIYLLVSSLGAPTIVKFIESVPEISEEIVDEVSEQLSESGLSALVTAPLQGYPYKIYSVQAAAQDVSLGSFLLWSIPSRLERLLPVTLFAGLLGVVFKNNVQKYTWYWLGAYTVVWIAIYAFYWSQA